jgi:ParB/RepB/Spo0J family partition protein
VSIDVGKLDAGDVSPPGFGFPVPMFPHRPPPHADLTLVEIGSIDAGRNLRTAIGEDTLPGLQDSIRELGQLQPIIVRQAGNELRLIAGHRRLEAARRAGEKYIEARVYAGDGATDLWEARARLAENVQRLDLNHIELAGAYGQAADAGLSVREIAEGAHISDDHIRRHLALRRLCAPVAQLAASGRLPVQQAELIARVGDPARQIGLAGNATRLVWESSPGVWRTRAAGRWRGGKLVTDAEQDVDDRDFVEPMDSLRDEVGRSMRGMAACGWPMDEQYAGKRACQGCPDNTLTYSDQPKLFEGIEPQGSAKKGHCTNAECYEAKRTAWDKVLDHRRKERQAEQKKAAAKAKKAGLEICQCGKVIDSGQGTVDSDGGRLCPKCAAKAKKVGGRRGGGGGESWEAREKRIKAAKKAFPSTPEQRLAAALHKHGVALGEMIGTAIAEGRTGAESDCRNVAEMVIWAMGLCADYDDYVLPQGNRPKLDDVLGAGISDKDLAAWWNAAIGGALADEPGLDYQGKEINVPLSARKIEFIADLERLAKACVLEVPVRPTAEVDSGQLPKYAAAKAVAGKPKKRQGTNAEHAEHAEGEKDEDAKPAANFFCTRDCHGCPVGCATPGDRHERMRIAIVTGKRTEAEPAIERCADLAFLKEAKAKGLKGDWRRAAVAKRIDLLREDAAVAANREAFLDDDLAGDDL